MSYNIVRFCLNTKQKRTRFYKALVWLVYYVHNLSSFRPQKPRKEHALSWTMMAHAPRTREAEAAISL